MGWGEVGVFEVNGSEVKRSQVTCCRKGGSHDSGMQV